MTRPLSQQRLDRFSVHQRQRAASGVLTEPEVAHCRWLMDQGTPPRELSLAYQVSLRTMQAIRRRDTWVWVEPRNMTGVDPQAVQQAAVAVGREVPLTVAAPAIEPASEAEIEASLRRFRELMALPEPTAEPRETTKTD